jgi:ribonuclease HII
VAGVTFERRLRRAGFGAIAGLDEVGRGAWAGPLVAGAAVLPAPGRRLLGRLAGLRDSKQLTPVERERYAAEIRACATATGLGIVGAAAIDLLGLTAAGRLAMERAVRALGLAPDYLLIDAFPLPNVACAQEPIIFGDTLCLSIAAASVIAKVERDRLLDELARDYPGYAWERNKGYGTPEHRKALTALGPTPEHRRSYAPLRALTVEGLPC